MKLGDKKYFWKLAEIVDPDNAIFECECGKKQMMAIHDVEYGYNRKCIDCREVKKLDPMFMRVTEKIGHLELVHKLSIAACGEKGRGIFLCRCGKAHNLVITDVKRGEQPKCECDNPIMDIVEAKYKLKINQRINGWQFLGPAPNQGDRRIYGWFKCLGCKVNYERQVARIRRGVSKQCAKCARESRASIKVGEKVRNWTLIKYTRELKYGKATAIFRCNCGREVERPLGAITGGKSNKCQKCGSIPKDDLKKGDKINNWTFIEFVDSDIYHYSHNTRINSVRKGKWQCICGAVHARHLKTIRASNPNGSCSTCRGKKPVKKAKVKPKVESIGELWDIWFELAVQGRKDTDAKWRNAYVRFKKWAVKEGWEKGMKVYRTDKNELYSEQNCYIK